jgi:hypothetical protein
MYFMKWCNTFEVKGFMSLKSKVPCNCCNEHLGNMMFIGGVRGKHICFQSLWYAFVLHTQLFHSILVVQIGEILRNTRCF